MARQRVPGSISSRRVVAVRPDEQQLATFQAFADKWHCGLGESVLRLAVAGSLCPERAPLSDRAAVICKQMTEGASRSDLIAFATATWGLTHKQADRLIAEARAELISRGRDDLAKNILSLAEELLSEAQKAKEQNPAPVPQ